MKNFILEIQEEIWMDDALCKSSDTNVFFPVGMSTKAVKKIKKAIQVCNDCPVINDCLDYALRSNQDIGIWGGTTEEDRKYLRKKHKLIEFVS